MMKDSLKREYVPTPEIMSLVEKRRRIDVDNKYIRVDDDYSRGDDKLIQDGDYLIDFGDSEEDDSLEEYVQNFMDKRKKDQERMKKLEEFRLNMLKECARKKKPDTTPLDPILCRQLSVNRVHNKTIPTLLTVNEILATVLKYATLETIICLQRVSNRMHNLIEELVKGLKLPSIRVDTASAFNQLFLCDPSVTVCLIKANITTIRFKSRHDPWSKKYSMRRTYGEREKGLNRATRNKENEKRFQGMPPGLKLISLNVAEREDLDNLLDYYSMPSTQLHVYYCHDVGRSTNVMPKIKADINDSSCYKTIASHQLTYDPHGYMFDALHNYNV